MTTQLMLHCQGLLTTNCMIFTPCSLKTAGSCITSCPVVAVQSCRATHIRFPTTATSSTVSPTCVSRLSPTL